VFGDARSGTLGCLWSSSDQFQRRVRWMCDSGEIGSGWSDIDVVEMRPMSVEAWSRSGVVRAKPAPGAGGLMDATMRRPLVAIVSVGTVAGPSGVGAAAVRPLEA
jgi:hypothetical protein